MQEQPLERAADRSRSVILLVSIVGLAVAVGSNGPWGGLGHIISIIAAYLSCKCHQLLLMRRVSVHEGWETGGNNHDMNGGILTLFRAVAETARKNSELATNQLRRTCIRRKQKQTKRKGKRRRDRRPRDRRRHIVLGKGKWIAWNGHREIMGGWRVSIIRGGQCDAFARCLPRAAHRPAQDKRACQEARGCAWRRMARMGGLRNADMR